MSQKKDYYEILGVDRDVSPSELKKAYRKIAFKHHPDRNGSPESEDIFKEASEAYEVLSNEEKKSVYDRYGHDGLNGMSGGSGGGFSGFSDFFSGFDDIFSEIFGSSRGRSRNRARQGNSLRMELNLTFDEAAWGLQKVVNVQKFIDCETCNGKGVKDPEKDLKICHYCGGTGQIKQSSGFFMVSQTCPYCNGAGKTIKNPCKECSGTGKIEKTKQVEVTIPAGVDSGTRLKVSGEGEAGTNGGPPGDLYLFINVEPHPHFEREDYDLITTLDISYIDAILGTNIEIDGIGEDERIELKIPAGTQQDKVFTIRNKGVKYIGRETRGNLYIKINISIPKSITKREKELLNELQEINEENKNREKSSFFRKIINAFS